MSLSNLLNDVDIAWHKLIAEVKTGWMAFEGFLKPFLHELGDILAHIAETDLITLGEKAFSDLVAKKSEAEIISGLKDSCKALLPANVTASETALTGLAGAILSSAKVKLAADPTQNTNS